MRESSLIEELKRAVDGQRPWANFFWWHDRSDHGRGIAECGAARDLFDALRKVGSSDYSHPSPSGDRWPDCEAKNSNGEVVAVEVTDLVDPRSLQPEGRPLPWSEERLLGAIQQRLEGKDLRSFHGGKYAEVLLLIHTDEFYLEPTATVRLLQSASFTLPHGNLTRAFLLFSYWPDVGGCPVAELRLSIT